MKMVEMVMKNFERRKQFNEDEIEEVEGHITFNKKNQYNGSGGVSAYFFVCEGEVIVEELDKRKNRFVETIHCKIKPATNSAVVKTVYIDPMRNIEEERVYRIRR